MVSNAQQQLMKAWDEVPTTTTGDHPLIVHAPAQMPVATVSEVLKSLGEIG